MGKYCDSIDRYIREVLSDKQVAGKYVRHACQRHLDDLKKSRRGDWPYVWSEEHVEEACHFFPEMLEHTTGAYNGEPFELYPFQLFVVGSIFGWRTKSEKLRRFRRAFITMGRGGGKSPLAAGIITQLFAFDYPEEARAECYTVATKVKQANIIFEECKRFVSREKRLRKMIDSFRYNMSHKNNGSKLEPLASESKSADGLIPHAIAADELHEWREEHIGLFEKLETAMHKRRQPLWLFTTTAGTEDSRIWLDEYSMCKSVVDRNSKIEADHIFAFIAEIDDKDDPLDPEVWVKAIPILQHGVLSVDAIQAEADVARVSASRMLQFKRYYCNRMVEAAAKTFGSEEWALGNGSGPSKAGITPFGAFDLGIKDDMAALGWCWEHPESDDGHRVFSVEVDVFVPQGTELPLHRDPYVTWIEDGLLHVTARKTTDMQAIYKRIEERLNRHGCQKFCCDPYAAFEFGQNMQDKFGITTEPFKQNTASYSEPFRQFKAALIDKRLYHAGNPVLEWAARNVRETEDTNGHAMPSKRLSQGKIDPFVSVLMAFGMCLLSEPEVDSYATPGNLLL